MNSPKAQYNDADLITIEYNLLEQSRFLPLSFSHNSAKMSINALPYSDFTVKLSIKGGDTQAGDRGLLLTIEYR